jgi:hypothetical protein
MTKLKLAEEFFGIANAIAAFSVIQVVALVYAFAKEPRLVAALLRWRPYSSAFSKWAANAYMLGIVVCGFAEFWLRYTDYPRDRVIIGACAIATILRCGAVYLTSSIYLRIFVQVCREQDWLNKNQPDREFQTPRLEYVIPPNKKRLHRRAERVDQKLFEAVFERKVDAKDFPK